MVLYKCLLNQRTCTQLSTIQSRTRSKLVASSTHTMWILAIHKLRIRRRLQLFCPVHQSLLSGTTATGPPLTIKLVNMSSLSHLLQVVPTGITQFQNGVLAINRVSTPSLPGALSDKSQQASSRDKGTKYCDNITPPTALVILLYKRL